MRWTLQYWAGDAKENPVEKWLNLLTSEQLKSVTKELLLLERSGNLLRLPHSRPLGSGLFELRERKFGFRIYYAFIEGMVIVLLCAGDKSSQGRDIAIARSRLGRLKVKKE